jgi:four helix bundle protein
VTSNKLESDKFPKELFGYKRLIAWQKSNQLAFLIYKLTSKFPKEEMFGLISQLRRAGLSIPTNIVEGHARNNKKEFYRFLAIALSSLAEVEYLLDFSYELEYLDESEYKRVTELRKEVGHILWRLFISQKS